MNCSQGILCVFGGVADRPVIIDEEPNAGVGIQEIQIRRPSVAAFSGQVPSVGGKRGGHRRGMIESRIPVRTQQRSADRLSAARKIPR